MKQEKWIQRFVYLFVTIDKNIYSLGLKDSLFESKRNKKNMTRSMPATYISIENESS